MHELLPGGSNKTFRHSEIPVRGKKHMQYYGYAGNVLYVDLSTGVVKKEALDVEVARKFIGGWGMNQRLAYDLMRPGADPLSDDAAIIVGAGPLCGTLAPTAAKVAATMKRANLASKDGRKFSVATSMGGTSTFGHMLKSAGYDHLIITGRADKPVYLKVVDDDVRICDASDLWGKDVVTSSDELVKRHRGVVAKCGVWAIGPAGENLVTFAQVLADKENSLGRSGGAVLGSKKLKAVVSYGTMGIRVADPVRFRTLVREVHRDLDRYPALRIPPYDATHGGGAISEDYPVEIYCKTTEGANRGCMACVTGCHHGIWIKDGEFAGQGVVRGIFGDVRDFGRRLRIKDYRETIRLIQLIGESGLDKYTTLKMLYFLTRLYERGIISSGDTGGLELRLGDFNAFVRLVEKIVNREDIGSIAADGWYAVSQAFGVDASEDRDGAPMVKGADTMMDARFAGMTPVTFSQLVRPTGGHEILTNSLIPRGEDIHQKDGYWPERKRTFNEIRLEGEKMGMTQEEVDRIFDAPSFDIGRLEKHTDDSQAVCDSLGTCSGAYVHLGWPMRDLPRLTAFYNAATGFQVSIEELRMAGERVWNLERLLNFREGFSRQDDEFPAQWVENTETPLKLRSGDSYLSDWSGKRLAREDLERILDDYYDERGWDIETGVPTKKKLAELELEEFAEIVPR